MTRVWIDADACMGAGTCAQIAPDVFHARHDGTWAVTGLVVFIAGIFALHATTNPPRSSDVANPPLVSEPAAIQGMDLSVHRALESKGRARALTAEELATIPAAVARTLIEYGAALTLESGGDR